MEVVVEPPGVAVAGARSRPRAHHEVRRRSTGPRAPRAVREVVEVGAQPQSSKSIALAPPAWNKKFS